MWYDSRDGLFHVHKCKFRLGNITRHWNTIQIPFWNSETKTPIFDTKPPHLHPMCNLYPIYLTSHITWLSIKNHLVPLNAHRPNNPSNHRQNVVFRTFWWSFGIGNREKSKYGASNTDYSKPVSDAIPDMSRKLKDKAKTSLHISSSKRQRYCNLDKILLDLDLINFFKLKQELQESLILIYKQYK